LITHSEITVDPIRDLEIIFHELRAKDIENLQKAKDQLSRGTDQTKKDSHALCLRLLSHLQKGEDIRTMEWNDNEVSLIKQWRLFAVKPRIYLINMSSLGFLDARTPPKDSQMTPEQLWISKIEKWAEKNGNDPLIPFSVKYEQELIVAKEDEELLKWEEEERTGVSTSPSSSSSSSLIYCKGSQIPDIVKAGYQNLNLIHYFTVGPDEVKCWTVRKGITAPEAAGVIHSDFEKGFIKAEVMNFGEFQSKGSEAAMKACGRYRTEGRDYIVEDGDIMFFKFKAK